MASNKRISIANLEFDGIKQNLKEFLKGQDQFTDFDFEGSNMSILLDVLAYNTHYNAMYTNMALNELYLDSASRRGSVVSLAKSLGYTPRSARCASTLVDFTVTGVIYDEQIGPSSYLTLPKGTAFQGIKDSTRYSLYTKNAVTTTIDGSNNYNFTDVVLIEGSNQVNRFEYTTQNNFIIPNAMIDTTTLIVKVQPSPNSTQNSVYSLATNFATVDSFSEVYFLKEMNGYSAIYFGDDIIGKSVAVGSIITVEYFVCSGEEPNGIRLISYSGESIDGGSVSNLSMQTVIGGGKAPETIEEIRNNAPNFYASQNRAVSAIDYETLILSKSSIVESVSVWGGENNVPPVYGKVFISAKSSTNKALTLVEKTALVKDIIDPYKMVSVIPEFVDPAFIKVNLDLVVYYDSTLTQKSASAIRALVTDSVIGYNTDTLGKFNEILRTSALSRIVESADPAIISCVPRYKIVREVDIVYNVNATLTINIGNPFVKGTLSSTGFYLSGNSNQMFLEDYNNNSEVSIIYYVSGVKYIYRESAGTLDYSNGVIVINSITMTRSASPTFDISVTPSSPDVASIMNQIVYIDSSKLKVSMVNDESTKGRLLSGNKFQFTQSRI